jgi:hypothetical protein
MPSLGPETHSFGIYVHYDKASPKEPQLSVYLDTSLTPDDKESMQLHQHAEDEDLEARLIITRTVTEDAFHQSTKHYKYAVEGEDWEAVQSAINYLKQLDLNGFDEFVKAAWTAAWGHASGLSP